MYATLLLLTATAWGQVSTPSQPPTLRVAPQDITIDWDGAAVDGPIVEGAVAEGSAAAGEVGASFAIVGDCPMPAAACGSRSGYWPGPCPGTYRRPGLHGYYYIPRYDYRKQFDYPWQRPSRPHCVYAPAGCAACGNSHPATSRIPTPVPQANNQLSEPTADGHPTYSSALAPRAVARP